jgi:hypothetical protein
VKLTHHGEGACVQMADHEKAITALQERNRKLVEVLRVMVSPVKHLDGCLWKSDPRMPCQCGYHDRINSALNNAHALLEDDHARG